MADLTCNFYYLHKRRNSTKKPTTALNSYAINLKDNTSFLNPTIEVYLPDYGTPFGWNYAYISEFGKYYYIKDYRWSTSGFWEIDLILDVLASHVEAIRAGTYYILYAETAFNTHILDNRIQQLNTASIIEATPASSFFDNNRMNDYYVLQFLSINPIHTCGGSIKAVEVTKQTINDITFELFNAGSSIWEDLQKQFGNAAGCIVGCHALPIAPITGATFNIQLGDYDTGKQGLAITNRRYRIGGDISIPWQANDFRRLYHSFKLTLPYIGTVTIDAAEIASDNAINVFMNIDVLTGDIKYTVSHSGEAIIPFASFTGNCASRVPISSYQNNPLGAVTALAGTAAGINSLGSIAGSLAGGIANMATSYLTSSPSVVGSFSGCAEYYDRPVLTSCYHPTCVDPSSVSHSIGRPYFAQNTLQGFSGYVQCQNAHVAGGMLADERAAIEDFLNTGIYLE